MERQTVTGRVQSLLTRMLGIQQAVLVKQAAPVAETKPDRRSSLLLQDTGSEPQEPIWNYKKLLAFAETNWVLGMVFDAIIREALSPGWKKIPRFTKKCTNTGCGKEFQSAVTICDACQTAARDPNADEGVRLDKLLKDPNPENELDAMLKSILWQSLAVDDWYLSISYAETNVSLDENKQPVKVKIAKQFWVEDSADIKIVADKRGRLGKDEYFCPRCYNKDDSGDVCYGPEQLNICPKCNGSLLQTAYIQMINGEIVARFAKDEIVHGNSGKNLPRLYGIPKLIRLLRIILTMGFIDRYNLAAYSSGNLKNIIAFPEMDQKQIDELQASIEAQLKAFKTDPETGERIRPNRSLWLGIKQTPSLLNTLPPSRDMQSLEWYKFYREAVAAVYSVTPVFVSIIESGKSGNNPRMQIDVQNRATIEWQQSVEQPFNNQILPAFAIRDWLFKFNDVEPEDEERDARIRLLNGQAANVYAAAGFNVKMNADGEVEVSGEASRAVVGEAAAPGQPAGPADRPSIATPGGNLSQPEISLSADDSLAKMTPPIPSAGGGKRRQASFLKTLIPEHELYVEPFAGGAAVFFSFEDPPKAAVLNDINERFTTVWKWIQNATPADVAELKARKWSATRDEWFATKDKYAPKTLIDKVWHILYVTRHSFMNRGTTWWGVAKDPYRQEMQNSAPAWLDHIDHYKQQLANTRVETKDWKEIIKERDGPGTFFYIDPPYEAKFADELVQALANVKGRCLISFSDHPGLAEGLSKIGFQVHKVPIFNQINKPEGKTRTTRYEILAANYPIEVPRDLVFKSAKPSHRYLVEEYPPS